VTGVATGSTVIHASALPFVADTTASITVIPGLAITTTSLSNGKVGTSYSQTLVATGGTTPYTWTLTSGTLPNGLTLNASSGQITGTPTTTVTNSPLQFTVTDSSAPAQTATVSPSITITL